MKLFAPAVACALLFAAPAPAAPRLQGPELSRLIRSCAPGAALDTMAALVRVESGGRPFAVGVRGAPVPQPENLGEALAAASRLAREGRVFALGIAQINARNLKRLGLDFKAAFDPCRSLEAGARILSECFARSKAPTQARRLSEAFSCYYSGDLKRGIALGYSERVARAAGVVPGAAWKPAPAVLQDPPGGVLRAAAPLF